MELMNFFNALNALIWHNWMLYAVLATGVLFTVWSGFCQYRALTHGVAITRGKYDDKDDPGAISHFQALSAALSATVGLGNIGGVALAISLGGPGAVFWMWVVGLCGMAVKLTEVTLTILPQHRRSPEPARRTDDGSGSVPARPVAVNCGRQARSLRDLDFRIVIVGDKGATPVFQAWNWATGPRATCGVHAWRCASCRRACGSW